MTGDRYQTLLESIPSVVYEATLDGVVHYVAPHIEELTGYPRDAFLEGGTTFAELIDPADRERVCARWARGKFGDRLEVEFRIRHRNGSIVWVLDRARVHADAGGEARLVGCLADTRSSKRSEGLRLQAVRLATLGELAAGLAHEINNPLSGVLNYAQLAGRVVKDSDPRLREALEGILAEGNRILETTQSLLTLARPNDDTYRPLDVGELVRSSITPMRCGLRDDFIVIGLELEEGLPPMRARGHGLRQVLQNLLINARCALNARYPERDPAKRLVVRAGGDGEQVYFEVYDAGDGMTQEARDRLFEPFFTTRPDCVGLGLSISREIVSAHKGSLDLSSAPGEGTTFRVTVPVWTGA